MSGGRLHAVIIAGGAGERFWPQSRRRRPKPLLAPLGGKPPKSLLAHTLERARAFAPRERTWLVCTADNAARMRRAAGLPAGHVWVEPRGRDTAMAVGFAATRLAARDPDAVMAVLPADHLLPDRKAFGAAVRHAAAAAARAEVLVTLGIRPTRPETGYGYLRIGKPAGRSFAGLYRVARFVEKPALARARRFAADGRHLWNAGIFVWRAATLLEELERCAPAVFRALAPVRERPRGRGSRRALEQAYRRAPKLSIDFGVLEKSRRVWTLPVRFAWSDVGNWAALAEAVGVTSEASRVIGGRVISEAGRGNLIWGGKRPIALLGVEGLAVIDTGDALLVARLDRSGDLKQLVSRVREELGSELL